MIADSLYSLLARKLQSFENGDAAKLDRLNLEGKAREGLSNEKVGVTVPRRAHNPILRSVPWHQLPQSVSWLSGGGFQLNPSRPKSLLEHF